jgi:hypothetical protein
MDRLTAQLRSLADDDAARTDPAPETIERGWTRLCGALAAPAAAAPVGIAMAKTIGGALAVLVLGVSVAAAPTAIDRAVTQVEPVAAETPRALQLAPAPAPRMLVAAPPPAPAPRQQPQSEPVRKRVTVDPLVAELRALAAARAHLDAGRFRQALGAARKLLRSRDGQLRPEALAIEAIAACELALPHAAALATSFSREHPSSPHRKRIAASCRR